jgi:hypothetical protein
MGITFGVPSLEAVATGNTFILENASFISAVSFAMVGSPSSHRDYIPINFAVRFPGKKCHGVGTSITTIAFFFAMGAGQWEFFPSKPPRIPVKASLPPLRE